MKKFSKYIGISTVCAMLFFGFAAKASTGDVDTGSVATGSIATGTTIAYTGSLLNYLNSQKSVVGSSLTTAYTKLYTAFAKTGLNILKSIEYQSLVCLGAIKTESLLSLLQKDKTSLTTSFQKDFIDLENQIGALEEKKSLQDDNNVNVFDAGTTYESEKAKLKDLIDAKVKLYQGLISGFESTYTAKNTDFLSTYLQYSIANKDLVKGIQDKMAKVQVVFDAFSGVTATVAKINAKVTGLDDLIKKMEDTRDKGLIGLDKMIKPLIDKNVKQYKKLQTLLDELTNQKTFVLGEFQMDLDEYLTNNLQTRYDRSKYLALKAEVESFKSMYYTANNQLNCSSILAATDASTALLTKIAAMKASVNSGLAKIEAEGVTTTFKDQLYSGFQSVYVQKFKLRYNEYVAYLKDYVKTALRNFVASLVPTTTTTTTTVPTDVSLSTIKFTRAFKKGEYSSEIKALQTVLTTLGFYTGAVDGVYSKATINAVYQFQLSNGLVNAGNSQAWGWMGPATRTALNKLTK